MEQEREEEREKLFIKVAKVNQKIILLMNKKSEIDEEIYALVRKRDKILSKMARETI